MLRRSPVHHLPPTSDLNALASTANYLKNYRSRRRRALGRKNRKFQRLAEMVLAQTRALFHRGFAERLAASSR
jgi:hypothetical protein